MKIAILTFHCAHNYGAVLQCYALQEHLKNEGHEVMIADYRPDYLIKPYTLFAPAEALPKSFAARLIYRAKELIKLPMRAVRHGSFETFMRTWLNLTKPATAESISPDFDAYIVGSDQIWNPRIGGKYDGMYFCQFGFAKGEHKYISYAASAETDILKEEDAQYLTSALKNFDHISVREQQLNNLLSPLTNKPITTVIDPTLLVERRYLDAIATPPHISEPYILIYVVRKSAHIDALAKQLSEKLNGMRVIVATSLYRTNDGYHVASPERFLGLIKHAEYVIASSFHGVALSVRFERRFYVVHEGKQPNTRIANLLGALGLSDRLINGDETLMPQGIDYDSVNQRLDDLRKISADFLSNALKQ